MISEMKILCQFFVVLLFAAPLHAAPTIARGMLIRVCSRGFHCPAGDGFAIGRPPSA
jgi:hypothetical protein